MDSNNIVDNETESSILDSQGKRLPEEIFAEIIKSSTEYTTENVDILKNHKSKILLALKTHRPLKITDYIYGLTQNLGKNRRLIIFEWTNKHMVREYYKHWGNFLWRCLTCERQYKHELRATRFHVYLVNGIVFAPLDHCNCPPRDYDLVMQYQKFLEEGNKQLASRMVHLVNFDYGECSLANVINKLKNPSAPFPTKLIPAKTSANLKRKSNDTGQTPTVMKKSKVMKAITEETTINKNKCVLLDKNQSIPTKVQSQKNKLIGEGPSTSVIQDQNYFSTDENSLVGKLDKKKSLNGKSDLSNNQEHRNSIPPKLLFKRPSTWMLKEICNKLGIKYCKNAIEFLNEIMFKEINFSSSNIKTQKFKTKNFYKILSNFFTGKFCDYGQIYYAINCAFRDKLVDDGKLEPEEIDSLCSSYTVTNKHFKFISKFLSCRILIFDDDADLIRKYGEWKNTNNALTLVLSFSDRKYSVVVNL